jgi:serine/threonine protein kinase
MVRIFSNIIGIGTPNSIMIKSPISPLQSTHSTIGNKMSDFKVVNELGRGSYGVVYRVVSNKDSQTYVLKKITLTHLKPKV